MPKEQPAHSEWQSPHKRQESSGESPGSTLSPHSGDPSPLTPRSEGHNRLSPFAALRRLGSSLTSRPNWPLILGGLIVLLTFIVIIAGPRLAPRDPAEENAIIKTGDEWKIPPFAAFSVPGFPLGSDEFGRDLLSRLLWAIRPTMTMVLLVAAVRLTIGVVVGLCAGWFTGWRGRVLDGMIGIFLSIPVLMVALGAIAAIGIETGIRAFIIGLSINGWVETAQLVREQTRIIKGQMYVEAARALGASDSHIILGHALRQIMPMVWMLFAFEIGGTLMVAAALGFLGYYIGGDVWVVVTDTVARRISGTPELGQMLATTWVQMNEPWGMIAVGSVIFIVVLGFNLLGRGLRRRLARLGVPSHTRLGELWETISARVSEPIILWVERRVWQPLAARARARARLLSAVGLVALVVGGSLLAWWAFDVRQSEETLADIVPEGHLWTTERRDSQGTLWSQSSGDIAPQTQWVFKDPAGFTGGPAVSKEGTVYITSKEGTLYALDPAGNTRWQVSLPTGAVGTPALDTQGQIYVTDKAGNLSAFSPGGDLKWRFMAKADDDFATSGPIVASDGSVYYMLRGNTVQAVSLAGEELWKTRALYNPTFSPPRLSADGEWLFVENAVLDSTNGALQEWDTPMEVDQYLMGADGETYLQSGNDIVQWQPAETGIEAVHNTTWDYRKYTVRAEGGPTDLGVTPQQLIWLLYSSNQEDTRIVWLERSGSIVGNAHYAQRGTQVIAVDHDGTTYACGPSRIGSMECMALAPKSKEPLWLLTLESGSKVSGGARVPGRLYAAMDEGLLYAIGESQGALEVADQNQGVEPAAQADEAAAPYPPTEEIAWVFHDETGFSGGPAALDDGTVYAASKGGVLYAFDPAGNTLWETSLPDPPIGALAADAQGNVYVADRAGNLSAFGPDGSLLWRFQPPEGKLPNVGPLVGPDGTIYYTVGSRVQAVSAAGEGLWQTRSKTFRPRMPLQLTTAGDMLFYADDAFDTSDGALLELESQVEVDQFIAGKDGLLYLRAEHTVMQWQRNGSSIEIVQSAQWNYDDLVNQQAPPQTAGVTQEHVVWISYYGGAIVAWLEPTGEVLGTVFGGIGGELPIAVLDQDASVYVCGMSRQDSGRPSPYCGALAPGSEEPIWLVELESSEGVGEPIGGALSPQRLYVTTQHGFLFALGKGQLSQNAQATAPSGPIAPPAEEIAWTFTDPAGFASGPAVSKGRTAYIASKSGTFYALDPAGNILWKATLPAAPVGAPALSTMGDIYQADKGGNLSAFSPDGSLLWRFQPPESKPSTVGPLVGPDGTIYYTVGGSVLALSANGKAMWQTRAKTFRPATPLQLTSTGEMLFYADDVFDTSDGALLELESPVQVDQFIAGNDGQTYLRSQHTVIQWQRSGSSIEIIQSAQWNYRGIAGGTPPGDIGVTQEQIIWLAYTTWEGTIAWVDISGQILGTARAPFNGSQLITVLDGDATAYFCGARNNQLPQCLAFSPGSEQPIWQVELNASGQAQVGPPVGGVLLPERLYAATEGGFLYAIGKKQPSESMAQNTGPVEMGPTTEEIAWTFQDPAGFYSGPTTSADGTIYVASDDTLYALDPGGNIPWEAALPAIPIAAPALDAQGNIYLSDREGNLSSFAPDGSLRWRYQPPESKPSTVGPLVGSDGTVYYTVGSNVLAVSANGDMLWQTRAKTFRARAPLQLSAAGDLLFYGDDVFDARDGALLELDSAVDADQFIAGNDGQTYLRAQHTMIQWQLSGSNIDIVQSAQWDYSGFAGDGLPPLRAGVTKEGVIWLMYTHTRIPISVAWVNIDGQIVGTARSQVRSGQVVGVIQEDATVYACGLTNPLATSPTLHCLAFSPGSEEALWQVELETSKDLTASSSGPVTGGALGLGRLYVATRAGLLYAIGGERAMAQAQADETQPPAPTQGQDDENQTSSAPAETPASTDTPSTAAITDDGVIVDDSVIAGDTLTYTLTVVNNGPSDAVDVTVTDTLPADVTFISAAGSQGSGCTEFGGVVVCSLGDLPNGAGVTVTIMVRANPLPSGTVTISHSAAVASQAADPNAADNVVEKQSTILAGADLSATLSALPNPAIAGEKLTYTLTIVNHGPADATDVTVTDTLSEGVVLLSATASQGSGCTVGQDAILSYSCDLGNLPNGSTATITIILNVDPFTREAISHSVTVTAREIDPDLSNNSVDAETPVSVEADLTVTE